MPRQSIAELRNAIESAPEMSPEHRAQILELVESLEKEVEIVSAESDLPEAAQRAEKLRGAIAVAGDVVRKRAGGEATEEEPDLGERLAELEEKVEMVALEHPVIANVLNAIARLV